MTTNNLQRSYGSGASRFEALKGVSMHVEKGEALAILGRSGSGKSTLLHLLGALDRPSGGQVSYRGTDLDQMSTSRTDQLRNREFGYVFQQFHLDERSTVLENVAMPLMIAGVPIGERRDRVVQVLDRLGLADRIDDRAGQLSGGQRQRVAIARAVVNRPQVVFADEPTGALDRENGEAVTRLLFELNQRDGITLVLVTHSAELAQRCDRSITIVDGELAAPDEHANYGSML